MAIYPLYSRYIVGWGISNSLEAKASIAVMKQAVKDYGKPEIINSDQGIYALLQLRITSSRELTERLRRNVLSGSIKRNKNGLIKPHHHYQKL
jgi:transposase InsO family protein